MSVGAVTQTTRSHVRENVVAEGGDKLGAHRRACAEQVVIDGVGIGVQIAARRKRRGKHAFSAAARTGDADNFHSLPPRLDFIQIYYTISSPALQARKEKNPRRARGNACGRRISASRPHKAAKQTD